MGPSFGLSGCAGLALGGGLTLSSTFFSGLTPSPVSSVGSDAGAGSGSGVTTGSGLDSGSSVTSGSGFGFAFSVGGGLVWRLGVASLGLG